MFKWKYGRFMPFYAPDGGADGGQSGGTGDNGGEQTPPDTTDYKALYEQEKQEKLKFKEAFDKKASRVSELEKAQRATMTEQQLKEAENAEKEQRYQEAMARVAEMETSTLFAENGFDKKDYDDVAKKIVEVGGDKAKELAETLIEFVKKANKSAVASARNGKIVDGAVTPQTSTANDDGTSFIKEIASLNKGSRQAEDIKKIYG